MKPLIAFLLLTLPASAQTASAQTAGAQTAADQFHPRRGINFDIWNEWLTTDDMLARPGFLDLYPDWRIHVTPKAIAGLVTQGYDFARLPMDPAPLLALGPGPAQDALIDQIGLDATLVQSHGLKVIVDMHSFPRPDERWGVDTILADPALFAAYTTLIGKIAQRLDGMDPTLTAFELMNEPTSDCDAIWGSAAPTWPAQLAALHEAARQNAPDLPLVVSGACWGGPEGLGQINPQDLNDDNLLYSFHSYTPFLFTHQGADWTDGLGAALHHLPYPPTLLSGQMAQDLARDTASWAASQGITTTPPATAENLTAALNDYRAHADGDVAGAAQMAAAWADRHHIPHNRLLLGEFGAILDPSANGQDLASRVRFIQAKRLSAEALGIGWAVWSWSGSFSVSDDTINRRPDPAICKGLGLTCP